MPRSEHTLDVIRQRQRVARSAYRLLGAALLAGALLLLARHAIGNGSTPIQITMLGPNAVRVRVAQGMTAPCDSGDDVMLVQGKFKAGEVVRAATPAACVCVQQTYEPFPDIGWGPSFFMCRPQLCAGVGRAKRCVPAPDPTIRIAIRSAPNQ